MRVRSHDSGSDDDFTSASDGEEHSVRVQDGNHQANTNSRTLTTLEARTVMTSAQLQSRQIKTATKYATDSHSSDPDRHSIINASLGQPSAVRTAAPLPPKSATMNLGQISSPKHDMHQSWSPATGAVTFAHQGYSAPVASMQDRDHTEKPYEADRMRNLDNRQEGSLLGRGTASHAQHAQDQGRGWGSFSSWINTAVSTVSVVIENPNVVVSKAQTIGQGIRNVATEQIDRVYESLDPEYEYERERQKQGGQQQTPHPLPSKQGQQDIPLYRATSSLPTSDQNKGDISDLLMSGSPQAEAHSANFTSKVFPQREINVKPELTGPSSSKLAYKEEVVDGAGDGWGDDAWGEDWGDQVDVGLTGGMSMENPPEVNSPTPEMRNLAPSVVTPSQPDDSLGLHRESVASQEYRTPQPFNHSDGINPPRNAHDILSSQHSDESDARSERHFQSSAKTGGLTVPSTFGGQGQSDQSSQRRPSTELRPAEALFSTLDFASNALGSAVLGVHRKVTQASPALSSKSTAVTSIQHSRPESPGWADSPQRSSRSTTGGRDVVETIDRLSQANPSLETVGGNVVSTGLGALEILGKRAVDVISDVIPPRMSFASLFDEAGGKAHLIVMRTLASAAAARVTPLTDGRADLLHMGQFDDLEQLLEPRSMDSSIGDLSVDLLAGHKDFRSMVALLEKMGVHGTAHLRHLRNCTRKLTTLVADTVNAFEQEWHNHQSRASEKDFFARAPIKKFFVSKLLSLYFDGLRALTQFTDRTCHQALKIAENLNVRVAEKSGNAPSSATSVEDEEHERHPPLILAPVLRQFLGSLIAEAKFVAKTYQLTMDAVLVAAKQFTTPLDNLDWDDLAMGVDKIKGLLVGTDTAEAVGLVHSASHCIVDILKNELILDALQGRLVPKPHVPRPISPTFAASSSNPVQRNMQSEPSTRGADNLSHSPVTSSRLTEGTPRSPHIRQTGPLSLKPSPSKGSGIATTRSTRPIADITAPVTTSKSRINPPPKPKVANDDDFFSILNEH
ncbi:hypothetical protein BGX28_006737 [Mortierella sp. GBA30]|nr:hypothetical protein BGX28_006737 [Mortierella sp. GBA30]